MIIFGLDKKSPYEGYVGGGGGGSIYINGNQLVFPKLVFEIKFLNSNSVFSV